MSQQPDVLILGGGVIGLTTAYYLSRAGAKVAVVDKGDLGQESSWAGAGIISPAPPLHLARHPLEQLAAHSARLHPELARDLHETTSIDTGYLVCGGWELFGQHEHVPVLQWTRQEIAFERVDEQQLSQREPALQRPPGFVFCKKDTAQLRNPRHVKALVAWCGRAGVTLTPGCPVHGFERTGQRIVAARSSAGLLAADRFLITSGAWSETLLGEVGIRPGIHPVRGQIVLLRTSPPVLRSIVEEGRRYLVPRPDGRVLVGSTEEEVGFVKQTTATAVHELLDFAIRLVPALAGAPVERCWAGLRPGSPDELPFLGRVPGLDNLFVAAGHYRAGIMLSPATGLVMKELLLGEGTTVPLEPFRLERG